MTSWLAGRFFRSRQSAWARSIAAFTLVELVMAIAIGGFVIAGVVVTSAELVSRSADPMLSLQRLHIAQAYLDEISAQTFDISTAGCAQPASGNREDYTRMCQYRAISNDTFEDQFGNTPARLAQYSVTVSISNPGAGDSNLGPTGAKTSQNDTALVTVTVTSPDGATTQLSGYFVNGA